ncbi:MAG: hypothetical protein R3362_07665, partial [Rhodothermales bacterium]|nr:hypothetical protein [Rhodothermales bacterium]
MPIPYKVVRDGLLLVKIEATEGVDANPGAADAIDADVFLPTMDARTEERQAFTGAADAPAPIINGRQITFPFSTELVGTADPSTTPPRISPALQACAWEQTLTASQITDTATGGSTTTAIVPTTNFSGADDAYLGMPVVLTGANIGGTGVGTFVTTVTDWVNSTGTLTFSDTIPRAVTSGDTVTIPTHARYHPGSVADA